MSLTATFHSSVGNYAPDFEIPGVDREVYHLSKYLHTHKLVCVVFLSNCCAIVRSQLPKLKEIQAKFSGLSALTVVGINSNDSRQEPEEGFEKMQTFAQQMQLNFPYLWDSTQDVALGFQVKVTPEVFVIDNRGLIRYGGSVEGLEEDLINRILSGENLPLLNSEATTTKTISAESIEAIGSPIKWRA